MIPEQYWQLARRWYWLIGLFGVLGAVTGYLFLPSVIGAGASYNSSATLAVSQYVPVARFVTDGADNVVLTSYTEALAADADSPQFLAAVEEKLAKQGIYEHPAAIDRMLTVTAQPTLFRVHVAVSTNSEATANAVATVASEELIARATSDDTQLNARLVGNLEQQRDDLIRRLDALADSKIAGTIEKSIGDSEAGAVRAEIEGLSTQIERLHLGQTFSLPVVMIRSPETVGVDARTLSPTDLLLLGTLAGLVAGWGAANLAERVTAEQRTSPRTPAAQPVAIEGGQPIAAHRNGTPSLDLQLVRLAERAADLERRARRLDTRMGNGKHQATPHPLAR